MPNFSYRAVDGRGSLLRGQMFAAHMSELELRLHGLGLEMISCKEVRAQRWLAGLSSASCMSRRDLIHFYFQLQQMLHAGVPMIEALCELQASEDKPRVLTLVATLIDAIQGGKTLSQAMAQHPQIFDAISISLVRAGEASGQLPEILERLVAALKRRDELVAHAQKLLAYPFFVLLVMLVMCAFIFVYLVPRMAVFIRGVGQALPWQTQMLLTLSEGINRWWPIFIMAPVVVVLGIKILLMISERARYFWDGQKLRLPWVGTIWRKIILARFTDIFALMYASGISVLDTLEAAESFTGNRVIAQGLAQIRGKIFAGSGVATAFQESRLFPPLVVRMLRIGESTAALDTSLQQASYFFNRDVREAIERLEAIMGPMMTVFLGLLMGWVMLATLGPIYDVITRLKI